jgi:hypothetical protein
MVQICGGDSGENVRVIYYIRRINKLRDVLRFLTKITGMAAIKNQEHICPRTLQEALQEIPIDLPELLGKSLFLLSPSTKVSEGHKLGAYYIRRHIQATWGLSR